MNVGLSVQLEGNEALENESFLYELALCDWQNWQMFWVKKPLKLHPQITLHGQSNDDLHQALPLPQDRKAALTTERQQ